MNEMELQHKKPCFSKASIGIIAGIAEVAVNHPLWVISRISCEVRQLPDEVSS